ncbi:MAG: phage integrase family protein [Pseudomonadota bacterium]
MPATKRPHNPPFPSAAEIAALRARLQGVPAIDVVHHYLAERVQRGGSAREILGAIRRDLAQYARVRGRDDLRQVIARSATGGAKALPQLDRALELLRSLPLPPPQITDDVERWLPARAACVLKEQGIATLAELTLRIPRSRSWWKAIPNLGPTLAAQVESFFAANPEITECARALVRRDELGEVLPLERQVPRIQLDGSLGRNRAPRDTCLLAADNDLHAIQAWLSLHEAPTTQRAYRKEAERMLLWAVVQLGKPLSSLTTEDAIAYRAFLREPMPRARWVGPHRKRTDANWRPFTGSLTPRSVAYALTVVKCLFGWLVDQHYLLANPFAGVRVRGSERARAIDVSRGFGEGEWLLVRTIANDLERRHGWSEEAAHRTRFLLDFSYATGLRAGELVALTLGRIAPDAAGDWWIKVTGKGAKEALVALPPLGLKALGRYLDRRQLPLNPRRWVPGTPVLASLEGEKRLSPTRLWAILHRTFATIAIACEQLPKPERALAAKLRTASPHWMRHTHASHALARAAELLTVRDNLRHASIATTSIYLRSEEVKRARQLNQAFG